METALPRSSGIYQIRCAPTNKIYVGSALDLRERWYRHRWSLRRGRHKNPHLQAAWDKYGEAAFEIVILELVAAPGLLRKEQEWIESTKCAERSVGFNIYTVAGSPGGARAQVWEGFINPGGDEVTIINLYDFCRRHGLDFPSMHRLASGKSKLKSYKGWTHRNSPRRREYTKTYEGFIAPDGHPVGSITNLAAFCRERGLGTSHMVAVARGRLYSHRGWTYDNGRQKLNFPKTHAGFINPQGRAILITNLKAFCHEHGLQPAHMHQLKSGRRKSHKGWTWRGSNG